MVSQKLNYVHGRIAAACVRCGRNSRDVRLVAVSKNFGVPMIQSAIDADQFDFGENYVQELESKRKTLNDGRIQWHFIGHLQANKAKYIVDYIHLIHSVDNARVAEEINRQAMRIQKTIGVLIELHTTDESTKFGVLPSQALELVKTISRYQHMKIQGLMTMGPFSEDPNDSRPSFQEVMALKKRIEREGIENVSMDHCSMGMTHDFEVAIEEGATIVRLGTAIFGQRKNDLNGQTEGAL